MPSAYSAVANLLGSEVLCTLSDGRTAQGKFVCIDRRRNMILSDCVERRRISTYDYDTAGTPEAFKLVERKLPQAMIPGDHLVKVEVRKKVYLDKVANILEPK